MSSAPIELDGRVERYGGGRVLLDPRGARVVRLSEEGAAALGRLLEEGPRTDAEAALGRRLVRAGLAHPRPPAAGERPLGTLVSVVVPVRDRPEALERCLRALAEAVPPGAEVVVVDDGSTDPRRTAAACDATGARLVRLASSRGPAGARNAGIAATARPLVAFLDSDCRPGRRFLEPLVALLEDPEVVAVAPRVRPAPLAGRRGWLGRYATARSPLDMGPQPAEVRPGGRVAYVPSAALLVRRSSLGEGFDEALRYGEDVDLVWRLVEAGGRVRYEPSVVVDHDEPSRWAALLARRARYGTSAGPLDRRHPGALAPLRVGPWPATAVLVALAGRPGAGLALVAVAATRLAGALAPREIPAGRAARLAAEGTLETLEAAGRAATALAWPALALLAARPGRGRRAVAALVLAPPLLDRRRRRARVAPLAWLVASVADEAAYGCGVWWGALRARRAGPLVPGLSRSSRRRWRGSPR